MEGLRVVRGPDWIWGDQDGGEGHAGTVIQVGQPKSQTSPDKTVVVFWDSGTETNYRVGYDSAYDLRIFDNAPIGVKHANIICDGCKRQGISGMRFKCTRCFDYDLCLFCYMGDKHDTSHVFQRFDTPTSTGVELSARKGCYKAEARGTFVGAKVVRGPHWEWGAQDGGKTGRVLDLLGWDNVTGRSVVNVAWTSGLTNIYRVGHKGRVDLLAVEPASAGNYYPCHLPVLGKPPAEATVSPDVPSPRSLTFNVGDKVRVAVDAETLRSMQEGHGGWNPRMVECVGAVGQVHRVTERGDVRVSYEGGVKWTLHPSSLSKVVSLTFGDIVRINPDAEKVRALQKGHGEWIDAMLPFLGKLGQVVHIYSDGDLRVTVEGLTWTLNPLCVSLSSESGGDGSRTEEEVTAMLGGLEVSNSSTENSSGDVPEMTAERLVREAAHGRAAVVQEFLTAHPDKVDWGCGNRTCLQVASHQGHTGLVKWLLSAGASASVADDEGDTPLHYAAFGNQPEVMSLLLTHGCDPNALNNNLSSALHVAVSKRHLPCVKLLLKHECDVNLQDSYGDTPLHDAIGNDSFEAIELLVRCGSADLALRNWRGFSPLHHAAIKGNAVAAERLIARSRLLVDAKKDDGYTALHLAALNGHRSVADVLLSVGGANVDAVNNRGQTAVALASAQGHAALVELLVGAGADTSLADDNGDTPLHVTLIKRSSVPLSHTIPELEAPTIYGIWQEIGTEVEWRVAVAIACYLVQEGSSLELKNRKDMTPLDLVAGTHIPELLKRYHMLQPEVDKRKCDRRPVECNVCSELSDGNTVLEPCGHRVACEDCTSRLKKCLKCSSLITRRVTPDGRTVPYKCRQPSAECLRYLETKIAEIEEVHCCSICMERRKNVAFLCGHGACDKCSATLRTCHMCRKPITKKINLY